MKNQFKFIFVLVAGLLMSTGNAFAQQSAEGQALVISMAAEVNKLMEDEGKTLEEAAAITVEKNAAAIKNNPGASDAIFKAVATVAASRGISPTSALFSRVITAVSNFLIKTVGVSESAVVASATNAGIPADVVLGSLPVPSAGGGLAGLGGLVGFLTAGVVVSPFSSSSSSAGGNAGSQAN
jgi:hypothetical protein